MVWNKGISRMPGYKLDKKNINIRWYADDAVLISDILYLILTENKQCIKNVAFSSIGQEIQHGGN